MKPLAILLLACVGCAAQATEPPVVHHELRDVRRGTLEFQFADHHKPARSLYTLRLSDAPELVLYLDLQPSVARNVTALIGQEVEAVGFVPRSGSPRYHRMDVEEMRAVESKEVEHDH